MSWFKGVSSAHDLFGKNSIFSKIIKPVAKAAADAGIPGAGAVSAAVTKISDKQIAKDAEDAAKKAAIGTGTPIVDKLSVPPVAKKSKGILGTLFLAGLGFLVGGPVGAGVGAGIGRSARAGTRA